MDYTIFSPLSNSSFISFASYKVIALPTIAVALVERAIDLQEAIEKINEEFDTELRIIVYSNKPL